MTKYVVRGFLLWCLCVFGAWVSTSRAEEPKSSVTSSKAGNDVDSPKEDSNSAQAPYKRPSGATTPSQRAAVQGKPCVDCGKTTPQQVADHKTPLVKEYYETGKVDTTRMREVDAVQPQCPKCSAKQGADLSRYSRARKKAIKSK